MTTRLRRQAIALLALVGLLISVYLTLERFGVIGSLVCTPGGGCEQVQTSRWAVFLGVPVPVLGVAGYAALLAVALAGLGRSFDSRGAATALLVLATGAFAFSLYLTALEAWVIHAWCQWCIASALIATLVFLLALPEAARLRSRSQFDPAASNRTALDTSASGEPRADSEGASHA